ncbi:MAG: hypothetical protein KBF40_08345 [Giesbergeria sp.]|jgi:hypothetical protein|nr:hypothetical protein [Giesbergeria sp.]MBP6160077.1 hypothetical protein [Giesbergeria sp.]MBP7083404.1 hypothetical protein [Giesbergeria sp.]MBP9784229.1 hypothetical protein [Giesbergeria sp.]MBP9895335.1 hypothetical protein [Giesbergeria sp.]
MILRGFDFGNEAGDDATPEELESYFVEQDAFGEYVKKNKRILITTARKGMGKSALIKRLSYVIKETDTSSIVIRCRGADLARDAFGLKTQLTTPNDYIRDWMIRICALINREIAKKINFAITDDHITLIESAEIEGYKEKNIVSCLTSRFEKLIDKLGTKKEEIRNHIEILKRVSGPNVYLLIDDLDATFQNTDSECLSLSTFFSACRYLAQDVSGICFRVTMRSDVWPTIRRYDESLDKLEQYVTELNWSAEEFRTLLYKRIESQSKENSFDLPSRQYNESNEIYELRILKMLFVEKIEWGSKNVLSFKVIHTLSYERPRWAIQLCKLAQESAVRKRKSVISKDEIDSVWGDYGAKRIADLVAEHKHQCKQIEELITAFRGADRLLTREQLMNFVKNRILNHIGLFVDSKRVTTQLEAAQFLFRIGFLVARSDEESGNYEHYGFRDMPDLLASRTDNDFNMSWEIHPCYRQALDIKKINKSQREKRGISRN